jgi:hypothetical protein
MATFSILLTVFCLALQIDFIACFTSIVSSRKTTCLYNLLKKGKMKEISIVLDNLTSPDYEELNNYLQTGAKAFGIAKHYDFFNSTVNRFNSITIMVRATSH